MCGRMAITLPQDAMAQMFAATPDNDLPQDPNFNVCPTNQIAVATSDAGSRRLRPMRWGFVPAWYKTPTDGPLLINARSETIAEKPAFRDACRQRRCLIAVDGFYEWERPEGGQPLPWYVTRTDGAPMVFAGIWQDWEKPGHDPLTACAIVTCAANADMARIHHRLPVVLDPSDWALWLGEEGKGAARLMRPAPDGSLRLHRVRTEVNSNRASGPQLIEPIGDAGA
ncbi:SOS response-associated peptidase [Loktanella sp. IMCC34160]|uniref:SOS response-associated peptidase n=1 Tax=Loktanella sp. IMCC34160 TaxID=2510646 RepID=UPI00101C27AE|nr:SOS response-associated peptidase [Loktanella sp. IMCC34160]RYG92970.1 SOS response-associated peptidase [Loktanella sp. IMCC34160]